MVTLGITGPQDCYNLAVHIASAHCKYKENLLSRKCKREASVSCGGQEARAGKLPPLSDSIALLNSLTPASLSLPLCPRYLDTREQREENVLSLQPPFGTSLAMHTFS